MLVSGVFSAYMFSDTQARSFLKFNDCQHTCLNKNEFIGLIASVGIQRVPSLLPSVVKETEKTIVIVHPEPADDYHYVIIPKRDIKNVGAMSPEDIPYLIDAYAVAGEIIRSKGLSRYRLWSSGPGHQSLTYLHFHVSGN